MEPVVVVFVVADTALLLSLLLLLSLFLFVYLLVYINKIKTIFGVLRFAVKSVSNFGLPVYTSVADPDPVFLGHPVPVPKPDPDP